MFFPFELTPFSVTGQPGSMNHWETKTPSTPCLGSRLRLSSAQPGPGPGLEEGTKEMHNGHDKNVPNSQLNDKLLTYNSSSNITLICVNVVA